MKEQLSRASGWIARPVAILALLVGAGAIGAALALAIDAGSGDERSRIEQVAERFAQGGEGSGENGENGGFGKGFGEGFGGLPEDFERFGEDLESFGDCLEEEGVEPFRGFGRRFGPGFGREFGPGFGGEFGPGPRGGSDRGFFGEPESTGVALESVHFRGQGGPGFGPGGEFDFEALNQAFEACAEELREELREPFERRGERFDERRERRGAFEECLRGQGVGPENRPEPPQRPDEGETKRLRDAFEQCRDELGGPFGGPEGSSGKQPEQG